MDRSLLPSLREIKVTDAASLLLHCKFSIAVFGYTSVRIQLVEDFHVDMEEAAEEYDWIVEKHTLVYGIRPSNKEHVSNYKEIQRPKPKIGSRGPYKKKPKLPPPK